MHSLPENFYIPKWLYRRWIWHAAFWGIYLSLQAFEEVSQDSWSYKDYWKVALISYIVALIDIYFTTFLSVPYLFYRKKYLLFAVACVSTAIFSGYFNVFLWNLLSPQLSFGSLTPEELKPKPLDGISIYILLVLLAGTLKVSKDLLIAAQKKADLAAQNMKGELIALRNQISPHFLLNSLNTIYGLSLTEPKSVPSTVLMLSDLLRFSLYETKTDQIELSKEIDFLLDFIELQRMRASEKLEVNIDIADEWPKPEFEIAPLLMLIFIENGFKYAHQNALGERFLNISIQLDKQNTSLLKMQCENSYSEIEIKTLGGFGLDNARRRLELLYPNRYRLDIQNEASKWRVFLEINLQPEI
jgi:two-component system, LytTR family, sensor kinase